MQRIGLGAYFAWLPVVAVAYFLLAKLGLQLASINPSASPIWAPTGLAFAAVILGGVRFFPAILIGAFAANAATAGTLETSAAIAVGNTLEGVVGGYLIAKWCGGAQAFVTPARIAKFAIICAGLPTMLSATIGVGTLYLAGFAAEPTLAPVWITWWLGDTAGALVVTPVIVLWAITDWRAIDGRALRDMAAVFGCAILVGLITFSPLLPRSQYTSPLGFLAILPLIWAALRRGPRDTATVAVILTIFAIWATIAQVGPFAQMGLNESFLLLLTFMLFVAIAGFVLRISFCALRRDLFGQSLERVVSFCNRLIGFDPVSPIDLFAFAVLGLLAGNRFLQILVRELYLVGYGIRHDRQLLQRLLDLCAVIRCHVGRLGRGWND